jgi:hypothetical protein
LISAAAFDTIPLLLQNRLNVYSRAKLPVFKILSIDHPSFGACDDAALPVEWAEKVSGVSMPDSFMAAFIHLAIVLDDTGPCGALTLTHSF